MVAIERLDISAEVGRGQHRGGARITRVDRQGLFEQAPCVIQRRYCATVRMQLKGFRAA
jgi:hypothetical protein